MQIYDLYGTNLKVNGDKRLFSFSVEIIINNISFQFKQHFSERLILIIPFILGCDKINLEPVRINV